jgi:hypothetical protein
MAFIQSKKTFADKVGQSLLCIDSAEVAASSNRRIINSAARNRRFHWVSKDVSDHAEPSKSRGRMVGIQPKRHSMLRMGAPLAAQTQLSLPHLMQRESVTPWLWNWRVWWVSESICSHLQPTINLARMDTIQSTTTFGVVDKRPLLCVVLGNPFATKRKRRKDSLAVESLSTAAPLGNNNKV